MTTNSLLHFDGTNGSTTITDSVSGVSWTVGGSAALTTSTSKFGSASLDLPDTDGYIRSTDIPALNTQDFTIEAWLNTTKTTDYTIFDTSAVGVSPDDTAVILAFTPFFGLILSVAGELAMLTSAFPASGSWEHIALTRDGNDFRLFMGGSIIGTYTSSDSLPTSGNAFTWGNTSFDTSSTYNIGGKLDECRILIGEAAYTAAFTPETSAFPDPTEGEDLEVTCTTAVLLWSSLPGRTLGKTEGLVFSANPAEVIFENGIRVTPETVNLNFSVPVASVNNSLTVHGKTEEIVFTGNHAYINSIASINIWGDPYFHVMNYGSNFEPRLEYNFQTEELDDLSPDSSSLGDYPNVGNLTNSQWNSSITHHGLEVSAVDKDVFYTGSQSIRITPGQYLELDYCYPLACATPGASSTIQFAFKFANLPLDYADRIYIMGNLKAEQESAAIFLQRHPVSDDLFKLGITYVSPGFNGSGGYSGASVLEAITDNYFTLFPFSWNLYRFVLNTMQQTLHLYINDKLKIVLDLPEVSGSTNLWYMPETINDTTNYVLSVGPDETEHTADGWLDCLKIYSVVAIYGESDDCIRKPVIPTTLAPPITSILKDLQSAEFFSSATPTIDAADYWRDTGSPYKMNTSKAHWDESIVRRITFDAKREDTNCIVDGAYYGSEGLTDHWVKGPYAYIGGISKGEVSSIASGGYSCRFTASEGQAIVTNGSYSGIEGTLIFVIKHDGIGGTRTLCSYGDHYSSGNLSFVVELTVTNRVKIKTVNSDGGFYTLTSKDIVPENQLAVIMIDVGTTPAGESDPVDADDRWFSISINGNEVTSKILASTTELPSSGFSQSPLSKMFTIGAKLDSNKPYSSSGSQGSDRDVHSAYMLEKAKFYDCAIGVTFEEFIETKDTWDDANWSFTGLAQACGLFWFVIVNTPSGFGEPEGLLSDLRLQGIPGGDYVVDILQVYNWDAYNSKYTTKLFTDYNQTSMQFDSGRPGGYLECADSSEILEIIGTGDFCVEMWGAYSVIEQDVNSELSRVNWFDITTTPSSAGFETTTPFLNVFSNGKGATEWNAWEENQLLMRIFNGTGGEILNANSYLEHAGTKRVETLPNIYYHIAVTREANLAGDSHTYRLFLNGNLIQSVSTSGISDYTDYSNLTDSRTKIRFGNHWSGFSVKEGGVDLFFSGIKVWNIVKYDNYFVPEPFDNSTAWTRCPFIENTLNEFVVGDIWVDDDGNEYSWNGAEWVSLLNTPGRSNNGNTFEIQVNSSTINIPSEEWTTIEDYDEIKLTSGSFKWQPLGTTEPGVLMLEEGSYNIAARVQGHISDELQLRLQAVNTGTLEYSPVFTTVSNSVRPVIGTAYDPEMSTFVVDMKRNSFLRLQVYSTGGTAELSKVEWVIMKIN